MNLSIQAIIDRIADAFSILDFSYIISGSIAYIILYWILFVTTPQFYTTIVQQPTAIIVLSSFVLIYSFGLFVSSCGAWVRERCRCGNTFIQRHVYFNLEKEWDNLLTSIEPLPIYNRDQQQPGAIVVLTSFQNGTDRYKIAKMYSYMWSSLASNEKSASRLNYINKFWVMQKVYEGLFIDAIIAFFTVSIMTFNNGIMKLWPCVLVCVVLFLAAFVFVNEANKCAKTQLHEVVSAYKLYCSVSVSSTGTATPPATGTATSPTTEE